jgi:hypothetical protein
MTRDNNEGAHRHFDRGPVLSRRGLLAASGTTLCGVALSGVSTTQRGPIAPETALLTETDLHSPGTESYVTWETSEAPLLDRFQRTVPGFTVASAASRSFRADPGESVPTVVESGVIALDGVEAMPLVRATAGWLEDRLPADGATAEAMHTATASQWRTRAGGAHDIIRLHLGGDALLVTIATGDPESDLSPEAAVERYATVMRRRAIRE